MLKIPGYNIYETLATSDHSIVYKATRIADALPCVIKTLNSERATPEQSSRFALEYELLASVQGPFVPKIIAFERHIYRDILVTSYFSGPTLAQTDPSLWQDLFQVVRVASAITEALSAIHQQDVVHKDLNPKNVLWDSERGAVCVIDFGLATKLAHESDLARGAKQVEGTILYISPEQTGRMNRRVDYRSDYYAFGATLFELVTGRPPFLSDDYLAVIHAHVAQDPPDVRILRPDVPETLARLIGKLLAKNAEDRYQSSYGIRHDLAQISLQLQGQVVDPQWQLACRDIPEHFELPQQLYGRADELAALKDAYARVISQRRAGYVLVGGASGTGKSALIRDFVRTLSDESFYFVSGKCDELSRHVPYFGLHQAIDSLCQQMSADRAEVLNATRKRVQEALGRIGQVIASVFPESELILGKTEDISEWDGARSHNRLELAMASFFQALPSPERPIILFLDDIQVVDASTVKLLENLLTNDGMRHLLLVLAFRDNEIDVTHSLQQMLDALNEQARLPLATVNLAPLTADHLSQFVIDSFRCEQARAEPLAAILYQKTHGNPFFMTQLLSALCNQQLITFDRGLGEWQWDLGEIAKAKITDNVLGLMIAKIQQLPADTVEELKLAACCGSNFDLQTLATIGQTTMASAADRLWHAIKEGLIQPLDDRYRLAGQGAQANARYGFVHDRVHQASYELIEESRRNIVHLGIGRTLAAQLSTAEQESRIFEIVNHLNLGSPWIRDRVEQDQLAQRNLQAGLRAKSSGAYRVACRYLETAASLLAKEALGMQSDLALLIHLELAESFCLAGDFPAMTEQLAIVRKHARTDLEVIRATRIEVVAMNAQLKSRATLALVANIAKQFGVKFKIDVGLPQVVWVVIKARLWILLHGRQLSRRIFAKKMEDPVREAVLDIIDLAADASFQINPKITLVNALELIGQSLRYGYSRRTSSGFNSLATMFYSIGDYQRAHKWADFAIAVNDRATSGRGDITFDMTRVLILDHHRFPLVDLQPRILFLQQQAMEMGDYAIAGSLAAGYIATSSMSGVNLDKLSSECEKAAQRIKNMRRRPSELFLKIYHQMTLNLIDSENPTILTGQMMEEKAVLAEIEKLGSIFLLYAFYGTKEIVSLMFGQNEEAIEIADHIRKECGDVGRASLANSYVVSYDSLACFNVYPHSSPARQDELRRRIQRNLQVVQRRAESCPQNDQAKYLATKAVLAAVSGETENAMRLFDEALSFNATTSNIGEEAVLTEIISTFYFRLGREAIAYMYLRKARRSYEAWGSKTKVRDLDAKFPGLRVAAAPAVPWYGIRSMSSSVANAGIDLDSVFRASRALASEVRLDRLLANLLKVLLENTGARSAALLLGKEGFDSLRLEGTATVGEAFDTSASHKLPSAAALPLTVLEHCYRMRKPVLLHDAASDSRFRRDPYMQRRGSFSVLCYPISSKGELSGILYLENSLAVGVFSEDRLAVVEIIAAEAAISIDHAMLYQSLEVKVVERTAALKEKTDDMNAMLSHLRQGIFTILEDGSLHHEYSRYLEKMLETSDLAAQNALALLFDRSNITGDVRAIVVSGVSAILGSDGLAFELNEHCLVREFLRHLADGSARVLEIDWAPIYKGSCVEKLLVTLRDVTELRTLQAETERQKVDLRILEELLAILPRDFLAVVQLCNELIANMRQKLGQEDSEAAAELAGAFRSLHTLKGNARTHRLSLLAESLHSAEHELQKYLAQFLPISREPLWQSIQSVESSLERYIGIWQDKLQHRKTSEEREGPLFAKIRSVLTAPAGSEREALAEIAAIVEKSRPGALAEIIRAEIGALKFLAQELGCQVPEVVVFDYGIDFNFSAHGLLRDVLGHCLRNSLDHGNRWAQVEASASQALTRIQIDVSETEGKVTLIYSDNGAGLDLLALKKVGRERGALGEAGVESEEVLAQLVFAQGVSTALKVTALSGRGVGMSAVKELVEAAGGQIELELLPPSHSLVAPGRRSFCWRISLPASLLSRRDDSWLKAG